MLKELNLEKQNSVAFVGAGGKTTALYTCVEDRLKAGQMAVAVTTTKMWEPKEHFIEWKKEFSFFELEKFILQRKPCPVTVGIRMSQGKIGPIPYAVMKSLLDKGFSLFIESDGARGKWIKTPNEYEPVVPDFCDAVVGILNKKALGHPFLNVAHRPQECAGYLGKKPEDLVEMMDFYRLWTEKNGVFRNSDMCKKAVLSGLAIGEGEKLYKSYKDVFQLMSMRKIPVFLWERSDDRQRVINTDRRVVSEEWRSDSSIH